MIRHLLSDHTGPRVHLDSRSLLMLHCGHSLRLIPHHLVSLQPGPACRCHAAAAKEAHRREEQWSCCHRLQPQHVPLPASPGQHAAPATSLHPHRWASATVSVTTASSDAEGKQDASWCLVRSGPLSWMTRSCYGITQSLKGVRRHCMHIVPLCSFSSAPQRSPLRLTSVGTSHCVPCVWLGESLIVCHHQMNKIHSFKWPRFSQPALKM